ncbi:MAG: uroporphyrinogen-III C-methyltransferase [Ferrimicrobium sp.]
MNRLRSPREHSLVALVGAGPGDPGLLTVRGLELVKRAEVVVVDYLVDQRILAHLSPTARLIDVGKRPGLPFSQQAINDLLVELSRQYSVVVRLKGGDPFLFGRGGEEVESLLRSGAAVEVVPGVSSALSVPAFAGIPVTHRGIADGCLVITGHRRADEPLAYDWEALVRAKLTIVVLMGVNSRGVIASGLLGAGMSESTPVAVLTWGTRPEQTEMRTTLGSLAACDMRSPSVIVIGLVAEIDLDWRASRPLHGMSVILTRAASQAGALVHRLEELGASVVSAPTIEIVDPKDGGEALQRALCRLDQFEWIVFTSPNAVERTLNRIDDLRRLGSIKIAVIGPGTAAALEARQLIYDLMPSRFVGEALAEAFPQGHGKVLFPRAQVARDVVPVFLRSKGWEVETVAAYQTVEPDTRIEAERIASASIAVFTSSSTVDGFVSLYGGTRPRVTLAIGPITARRLDDHGFGADIVAEEFSIDGVVEELLTFWETAGRHHSTLG